MKRKIIYYLGQLGYREMNTTHPEITLLFKKEESFCDLLLIMDMMANPYLTKDVVAQVTKHSVWRFHDLGIAEVHHLTLLYSGDYATAEKVGEDEPFCWILDPMAKKVVVPPGKVEDYYGMRSQLDDFMVAPDPPEQKERIKYGTDGKPLLKLKQQPLVNHGLFVVNVIVFMLSTLSGFGLNQLGKLEVRSFLDGEYYRIVTAMFLHGGIEHIAGNMLMLYYLGNMIEKEMGHIRYFLLYMLSGVCAGFASMAFQWYVLSQGGDIGGSVGASGAIFGILGGFLWMFLRDKDRFRGMTIKKVIWLIVYPLYTGFVSENVDNAAHVGGLIAGFVLAIFLYKKKLQKTEERL
ncbi:MAG: rhomboid family intramembrane serine protease [Lachnospiraceae bacterium]|nr:rhomboid family intramembrane serine protease [Lachnospiraceae bacterium]